LADVSAPLRKLTLKDAEWNWTETEENSFKELKRLCTEAPVLRFYDPKLPLTLSVDASSTGLGCVILQEGQPIAYGSRALTKTQQKYAQIEKETLALVFGCEKFYQYVYGRTVKVETDHKPLQAIFNKPLHLAPLRLQRFLMQLQKYDLQVTYKPGKYMYVADTLSRSFLQETREQLVPEAEINAINPKSYLPPVTDQKYAIFQKATAEDRELSQLKEVILKGWPQRRSEAPYSVRKYWSYREELVYIDGLIFRGFRLVVPSSLRKDMLNRIHESHLGIVKCKDRARQSLFWPGMSARIEEMVSSCSVCAEHSRANHKEPMIPVEIPDRPWSKIGADIFEWRKHHYLITVDYFSKWPEISNLNNLSAKHVIEMLKCQIAKYGIPDEIITDNGPQFACAEFAQFAKEYEFKHSTSSPYYPQANGQAERAVQTIKLLLDKAKDPYMALLGYRNTPLDTGCSPAQLFLGRRLKTKLPTASKLLEPGHQNPTKSQQQMKERQQKQKAFFDKKASQNLTTLHAGDPVMMKFGETWKRAEVIDHHSSPRSYLVKDGQRVYRRNRKALRPTNTPEPNKDNGTSLQVPVAQKDSDTNTSAAQDDKVTNDRETNTTQSHDNKAVTTRSGRIVKPPARFRDET
jgi:hypothetical protein